MAYKTIIVAYDSKERANAAMRDLRRLGVPASDIRRHPVDPQDVDSVAAAVPPSEPGGLWSWLFGADEVEERVKLYRSALQRGGTIISVQAMEEEPTIRACLDDHGPLDLEEAPAAP